VLLLQARVQVLGQSGLCWVCRASWVLPLPLLSLPQLLQALLLLGRCCCCWGLPAQHWHDASGHALVPQQQQQQQREEQQEVRCCLRLLLVLLSCAGPWYFLLLQLQLLVLLLLLGWDQAGSYWLAVCGAAALLAWAHPALLLLPLLRAGSAAALALLT
jgi:hypothetical protein